MSHETNAILAISSTDRYISNVPGKVNQPFSNTLVAEFFGGAPYSNDFQITAPNALINGYIDKIVVSQIQLQYNLPTVIPGRNSDLRINVEDAVGSSSYDPYVVGLPYGFYTPGELAALLEVALNNEIYAGEQKFLVKYGLGSFGVSGSVGFTITLNDGGKRFLFVPPPGDIIDTDLLLKTYKLFGINTLNTNPSTVQSSGAPPQFLYTPYIDIYSDLLTNYQRLKDTDSSTSKRKGLVSRLYLSSVGSPQFTFYQDTPTTSFATLSYNGQPITGAITADSFVSDSFGSAPFIVTYDLNSPKVINWSRDTAVNSLDFQLRDCYGDLLFTSYEGGEVFNTEFQMTLLCIEGD